MWSKNAQMTHCGRWCPFELTEMTGVPRSKLSAGTFLSAAGEPLSHIGEPERPLRSG